MGPKPSLDKRDRLYRQKRDPRPHSQVQGQAEHANKEKLALNLLQLNKTAVSKVIMIITVCVFTCVSTCCNDLFFQP